MSAAILTDTSHSTAENGQPGQNLLSETQVNGALGSSPITLYTTVWKLDVTVWCMSSLVQVAEGRHLSLPFLMQPKETYNHKCHCGSTSNKQRRMTDKQKRSRLLLKEQDGDDDDDDEDHGQHRAHDPQHFRLLHPLSQTCSDLDRV